MLNQPMDRIISWLVDLFLSLPHLVTLLLISFTLGGGMKGVVIGLVLTHWPSLTRILRAEMLQLQQTTYVQMSKKTRKRLLVESMASFCSTYITSNACRNYGDFSSCDIARSFYYVSWIWTISRTTSYWHYPFRIDAILILWDVVARLFPWIRIINSYRVVSINS